MIQARLLVFASIVCSFAVLASGYDYRETCILRGAYHERDIDNDVSTVFDLSNCQMHSYVCTRGFPRVEFSLDPP